MRRLTDEDGATAVLVALLMTAFLGFGALVVDVGQVYFETRQLQNGADAAALGIAQGCAIGDPCTTAAVQPAATSFAGANSNDTVSTAAPVIPGDTGSNSVTVTTSTLRPGGSSSLSYALAGAIGIASDDTFTRQATAVWGNVGGGATLPIAICEHAWDFYTSSGTVLPSGPPAHLLRFGVPPGHITALDDCSNAGGGDPYAGGFGFLERDAECRVVTLAGDLVPGVTGSHPGEDPDCPLSTLYAQWKLIIDSGQTVLIPIFDYYVDEGAAGKFHIMGYGGFKFEGYAVQGPEPTLKTYQMDSSECPGSASCIKGYFTEFVALGAEATVGGAGSYGATAVTLSR